MVMGDTPLSLFTTWELQEQSGLLDEAKRGKTSCWTAKDLVSEGFRVPGSHEWTSTASYTSIIAPLLGCRRTCV
jgi:hypothetical protein